MIGFIIAQVVDNFASQPIIFSKTTKSHPLEIFLIIIIDKVSDKLVLSYTFISGLFCGTIVTLNGIGIYFDKTLVAYLVGIIWHLFQGILAFSIIMLKSDKE